VKKVEEAPAQETKTVTASAKEDEGDSMPF
jgi:hypothetical protein